MPTRRQRFDRLRDDAGHIFMVPLDHGVSMGPATGVENIAATLQAVADHATCTTLHKGHMAKAHGFQDRLGLLMHLSASTPHAPDPDDKRIVGTVEEAVALGADGVSVHLNLGSTTEADQIEAIGRVSTQCNLQDIPLIAMVYPRGPAITDPFDGDLVAHAARLGAELGADAVKVPYTGDPASFARVVEGAGVPVIVAGGPKNDDFSSFLDAMQAAAQAGAAGTSVGRNVFQNDDPQAALKAIRRCFDP